ncbi:hypothetical protein C9J01_18810 [Photobacterium rosenbergii]|uniref:Uncharacterized protein n=1 Tax=Photobacterium rosenbergii TaxID=294936 RepID=A0A2T3N9W0_9GAMM|nr:hypothetical protein [Photobacterium rosenbergii]PSW10264.1 hypothetical protein C9J01_18810 [Photobacterium rosenbergii]
MEENRSAGEEKKSIGEKVVLYATFVIAVMSFTYNVYDIYQKQRSINSLSIFSDKTNQVYVEDNDYNALNSRFVFSNTGNRKIHILDAWLTAEVNEQYIDSLKEIGKHSEIIDSYKSLANAGEFSRDSSEWKVIQLNVGEVVEARVKGAMHFNPSDIYQILVSVPKNEKIRSRAREIYEITKNSRKPIKNYEDLRQLKILATRNSRYINLYLSVIVQFDDDKFITKKVLYDHVLYYKKLGVPDSPFYSMQLNSFFTRQNKHIELTL